MDDSTTSKKKTIPVKLALGRKWMGANMQGLAFDRYDMEAAYCAGFDKARELAVDVAVRFADPFVPHDGKNFSEHVAALGDMPYPDRVS